MQLGFVAAAVLGILRGVTFATVFGGISVVTFLAFFISQPLRALEQNPPFITLLGIIDNTDWTRQMYTSDVATLQGDLEVITRAAVESIQELIDKHAELAGKRPGLPAKTAAPEGKVSHGRCPSPRMSCASLVRAPRTIVQSIDLPAPHLPNRTATHPRSALRPHTNAAERPRSSRQQVMPDPTATVSSGIF
jgi:hypothetical protein